MLGKEKIMFGHLFSNKSNANCQNRQNNAKGMRARKTLWLATPTSMTSVTFTSNLTSSDRPVRMPK